MDPTDRTALLTDPLNCLILARSALDAQNWKDASFYFMLFTYNKTTLPQDVGPDVAYFTKLMIALGEIYFGGFNLAVGELESLRGSYFNDLPRGMYSADEVWYLDYLLGYSYRKSGNLIQAKAFLWNVLQNSVDPSRVNSKFWARCKLVLGETCYALQEYEDAFFFLIGTPEDAVRLQDGQAAGESYFRLAKIGLNVNSRAMFEFVLGPWKGPWKDICGALLTRSLKFMEKYDDSDATSIIFECSLGLGEIHFQNRNFEASRYFYLRALKNGYNPHIQARIHQIEQSLNARQRNDP